MPSISSYDALFVSDVKTRTKTDSETGWYVIEVHFLTTKTGESEAGASGSFSSSVLCLLSNGPNTEIVIASGSAGSGEDRVSRRINGRRSGGKSICLTAFDDGGFCEANERCEVNFFDKEGNSGHSVKLDTPGNVGLQCADCRLGTDKTLIAVGTDVYRPQSKNAEEDSESRVIFLASTSSNGQLQQSRPVGAYKECHSDAINCVCFHPNSVDWLASGGADGLVNVYDLRESTEDDALQQSFNCESSVSKVGWLPSTTDDFESSYIYAITDGNRFSIWDVKEGDQLLDETFEGRRLVDCFVAEDGIYPVFANADGTASVKRWRANPKAGSGSGKLKLLCDLDKVHSDMLRCVAYEHVSQTLVTGGEDGRIAFYKIQFEDELVSKSLPKKKRKLNVSKPY